MIGDWNPRHEQLARTWRSMSAWQQFCAVWLRIGLVIEHYEQHARATGTRGWIHQVRA